MGTPWRAARRTSAEVLRRETEQYNTGVRLTADSANVTGTEAVVMTLPSTELLAPSSYNLELNARMSGATAGDIFLFLFRENSLAGAGLGGATFRINESNINSAPRFCYLAIPIEISSPTTKLYVVTCQRVGGAGNGRVQAGSFAAVRRTGPLGVLAT